MGVVRGTVGVVGIVGVVGLGCDDVVGVVGLVAGVVVVPPARDGAYSSNISERSWVDNATNASPAEMLAAMIEPAPCEWSSPSAWPISCTATASKSNAAL